MWTDQSTGPWSDTTLDCWTDVDQSDPIALIDARLDLAAYALSLEDSGLDASAYYQSMEDCQPDLLMIGWATENLRSFVHAAVLYYADAPSYLSTIGEAREDIITGLQAVAWARNDITTYLEAHSGIVLLDVGAYLEATDGVSYSHLGAWLCAIRQAPAFRSTVAQRASSVIHTATWSSIEDASASLSTVARSLEDAGLMLQAITA